ncbi:pre-mRNA-splicing factor CWC21-like isoform X2 [Nicotiana tomentosiformis]|uniref:pre-mRNA-splicing factor CWC21-like isoform X2 n=1 Tax=Nicotiana tomentosiformis TaxID=4098 RepID=UPI00388CE7FC
MAGTNGHIQTNKFFVKPKTNKVLVDGGKGFESGQGTAGVTRKANKDILEHDRKRQIQLKLLVLEDKLTDQGYTDAEIAEKLDEARRNLEATSEDSGGSTAIGYERVSETQTHQIAALKERQMETLKAALKIGAEHETQKKRHEALDLDSEENEDGDNNELVDRKWQGKDLRKEKDEGKRHKKTEKKKKRADSSDTDSGDSHAKKPKKKNPMKKPTILVLILILLLIISQKSCLPGKKRVEGGITVIHSLILPQILILIQSLIRRRNMQNPVGDILRVSIMMAVMQKPVSFNKVEDTILMRMTTKMIVMSITR